jgi:competence protein ComGC
MSKPSKGITLIEMMIIVAIGAILVTIFIDPRFTDKKKPTVQNLDTISYCAAGYRFTRTRGEQMIGADGKPLLCN